jgi:hypothetical protein
LDKRLATLLWIKIIVAKSKEVKNHQSEKNLPRKAIAKKKAISPMIMMMIMIMIGIKFLYAKLKIVFWLLALGFPLRVQVYSAQSIIVLLL